MYNQVSCKTKAVFSRCLEPFKKQESHEVKEFGSCCCHLQKNELLTGSAEFARSKKCRGMAIKLLLHFLCTIGFIYQTWYFLQMYLAYPTTLDTSEEYPDSFIAPAITICNSNRLSRQPYCKKFPEKCTWEQTTWETFCDIHRRMCPEIQPPDFSFGIPVYQYISLRNNSNAFLNAVGPQEETNVINLCYRFEGGVHRHCNFTINFIQVPRNGFPYKCFSIFSLLGKHNEEQLNLTMSDGYFVRLDMHPEEQFDTHGLVEASVVLHDPRKLVNPMTEGITLTSGRSYQLNPSMEERESLPPPYDSKCIDYLSEWKKNGGSGPLSKDDCINECKIKAMLAKHRCVGQSVTYPNNNTICFYIVHDGSPEMNRMCTSSCRDACDEHIYHLTSDTVVDSTGMCDAIDEYCKIRFLDLMIPFNRLKVKKIKQIPRIESIELFSYIGGYLGMWLGISLASLFDLAEILYDVIDTAFLKRKRNQKTTTPIEQFRHHSAVKK